MNLPLGPRPHNSYSRADWTELQLRFRPPRDGVVISTRLQDYASPEEIDAVVAAVQQVQRELTVRIQAAKQPMMRRMSKAVRDDAALVALWAVEDRRRLGRLLNDLRVGERPFDLAGRAALLPEGSGRELLLQFHARYQAAEEAALEELRRQWTPPSVDDAAWEKHLRWMALSGIRFTREWLLPGERRLSSTKQCRLISERQNRFLAAHPERLEAVRRKAEEIKREPPSKGEG